MPRFRSLGISSHATLLAALQRLDTPFSVARDGADVRIQPGSPRPDTAVWIPAVTPDRLGDPGFQQTYGVRCNYVAGAMANGIGSADIVVAMARAGMLGMFGAAGLPTNRIRKAIDEIQGAVGTLPYGFNLIHSPQDPNQEWETVELYLSRGVTIVSASAYMRLTPQVVWYRCKGMHRDASGQVVAPNRLLAKVSREEVATQFMSPAPRKFIDQLVRDGKLSTAEAELAALVPMADDLIAEADSGGHTDNQPAPVLLPLLLSVRDRLQEQHRYAVPVRVGAAGGITTPRAAASAFAMGAAFVLTGTVNQACVEAGTSDMVKQMLATAGAADVGMAPASDMFEQGVEVQVLKRGTLFSSRGHKLYRLWRDHDSLDDIDPAELAKVEQSILRRPAAQVWAECERFFSERDPKQVERATRDPKHKMALVFRWYLGLSSRWAIAGDADRRTDAQVWCGPGIGAFNAWTEGSFLAQPQARDVVTVAANLMAGAAAITRARMLLVQGIDAGPAAEHWTPRPLAIA